MGMTKTVGNRVERNRALVILTAILSVFFKFIELITDSIFKFLHRNAESKKLPPIENHILMQSATSLASKIRNQSLTSEDVVRAFIERIQQVNHLINCVVDHRFEAALEEAKAVDKMIQTGQKDITMLHLEQPFLGVPFTIKDCFAVKGLKNTAGLVKRKYIIPENDADVVDMMKKAGAIILAVTNVSELCMWWESNNNIYGRSRNPYDFNRIVGGSSGGEAGILCAAGSPFGIGSDIGGSIRMPAFFNGIFGHKPTTGIVPNTGQQPLAEKTLNTFLVTGPMSRFCCDLLPMYRVLAARNIHKLKLDIKVDVSKLRVFYMTGFGRAPLLTRVHPDMKEAQLKVVRYLEDAHGIRAQKVRLDKLVHAFEIWTTQMTTAGVPSFAQELALRQGQIPVFWELLKCCAGQSEHTVPALLLAFFEKLTLPSTHPVVVKILAMCQELVEELQELLGHDGILLVPTHPTAALYHNQPISKPLNAAYTAVFNVLGVPITQVPLGLGSWGVPLGIQVVGALHNDHLTLAMAAELERAFGGWVSPSTVLC